MLMQEKISGPETLLKLYVAIDEDLKALQPQLPAKCLPRDPRGGKPILSAAEVLTILVWGGGTGAEGQSQSLLSRADISSPGVSHARCL